jgi:hypothetical protein
MEEALRSTYARMSFPPFPHPLPSLPHTLSLSTHRDLHFSTVSSCHSVV